MGKWSFLNLLDDFQKRHNGLRQVQPPHQISKNLGYHPYLKKISVLEIILPIKDRVRGSAPDSPLLFEIITQLFLNPLRARNALRQHFRVILYTLESAS